MGPAGRAIDAVDECLAEDGIREYLGDDERLAIVCTNANTGVERDGARIEPGETVGAVAAVTDRRTLFLVGDADGYDGDYAASVPYDDVTAVDSETEVLARALVVETGAGTWRFAARETEAVDEAVAYVGERVADHRLELARTRREAAETSEGRKDRIDALEGALAAFREAADLLDDGGTTGERERRARDDAEAVIADLVAAYCDLAEDRRAAGDWERAADNVASAHELLVEARDAFDRALELAETYPPGDPENIAIEREMVASTIEDLEAKSSILAVEE